MPLGGAVEQGVVGGAPNLLKRTDPLLVCELSRRACTEARVRPDVVIVVPPRGDDLARFPEIHEDVLLKALIAKFAVETFDESILYRLAGLDVVPGDPTDGPAQHRATSQFGTVVRQGALMADD